MLEQKTVYGISSPNSRIQFYLCEGKAKDVCNGAPIFDRKVMFDDEVPAEECDTLYQAYDFATQSKSAWFATKEEAKRSSVAQAAIATRTLRYNYAKLDREIYKPLEFPALVDLMRDEKGIIYARFASHPEKTGKNSGGKIYFIDREWKDVDVGLAFVSVKFESPRYGFVTGSMVPYGLPPLSAIVEQLKLFPPLQELRFISSPTHGDYLAFTIGTKFYRFIEDKVKNCWYPVEDTTIASEATNYVIRLAFANTLVFEHLFGRDFKFDTFIEKCKPSEFYVRYKQNSGSWLDATWEVQRSAVHSELSKAVIKGLLSCVRIVELDLYVYAVQPFENYAYDFSMDELEEIAAIVTRLNEAVDNEIKSLIRKGRVRLSLD